jgi:hypothetical protein
MNATPVAEPAAEPFSLAGPHRRQNAPSARHPYPLTDQALADPGDRAALLKLVGRETPRHRQPANTNSLRLLGVPWSASRRVPRHHQPTYCNSESVGLMRAKTSRFLWFYAATHLRLDADAPSVCWWRRSVVAGSTGQPATVGTPRFGADETWPCSACAGGCLRPRCAAPQPRPMANLWHGLRECAVASISQVGKKASEVSPMIGQLLCRFLMASLYFSRAAAPFPVSRSTAGDASFPSWTYTYLA